MQLTTLPPDCPKILSHLLKAFDIYPWFELMLFLEDESNDKDLVLVSSDGMTTENENQEKAERTLHDYDDNSFDVFHATNQWQTIKEGQSIPPGLHVQTDLQTGKKQAKLMDENLNGGTETKAQSSQYSTKQKYIKIDKNIISKQRLKDALKDFKDKFHSEDLHDQFTTAHGTSPES